MSSVCSALRLPGYWSHVEVHLLSDIPAARAVWEGALKGRPGRSYDAWAQYIGMERAARCIREARGLFRRWGHAHDLSCVRKTKHGIWYLVFCVNF